VIAGELIEAIVAPRRFQKIRMRTLRMTKVCADADAAMIRPALAAATMRAMR
jgi:hypothetical protein